MSLSADALITVDEYFAYQGTAKDKIPEDAKAQIELHINAVSALVTNYCGRSFTTPAAAIAEVFDGDGLKDYYAKNKPIAASPAPALAYWDGLTWTATTYTFTYVAETGRVYFTDGNVFWKGQDNWRLTYSYGNAQASVPADLKMAVYWMVHRAVLLTQKQGLNTENFGDQSTSYNLNVLMDKNILQIVDSHKRWSIG